MLGTGRNAGDRERECVGKERVQGFKEGSNAPDGAGSIRFKGSKEKS
jgi:hypothetical protein